MKKQIFRKAALERLASPEQLDELMQVATPRGWLAFLALASLLVAAVAWGIWGRIPIQVNAPAILLHSGGVKNVVTLYTGQVSALHVRPGDLVQEGQVVATLTHPDLTEPHMVTSPYTGRILELRASEGELLNVGSSLMSLELVGEEIKLQALLYVSPVEGKKIEPGMAVQLAPATIRREEHGFLMGRVQSVGDFPSTYQGMFRTLGSDELIRALALEEAPLEVQIELIPDPDNPSGYRWSSMRGPDTPLQSGTLGAATILIGEQRPIELILP